MNITQSILYAQEKLNHLPHPRLEAEVLLSTVIKKDRSFFRAHDDFVLTDDQILLYKKFIQKRLKNIPIAYILGYKEWNDIKVLVSEDTLIPRDETEILVQKILAAVENPEASIKVVDVGTGSGCIALYLATHLPNSIITGLDTSRSALVMAKKNFKLQGLDGTFLESDLLSIIPEGETIDIIAANLPYVPETIAVEKDLDYEPYDAIFSGNDGLDHIRRLVIQIKEKNIKFGALWLEFLPRQKESIKMLFAEYKVSFHTDDGGDVFFAEICS